MAALFVWTLGAARIVDLAFLGSHWTSLGGPAFLAVALTTAAFATGFAAAVPLGALRAFRRPLLPNPKMRGRGLERLRLGARRAAFAGGHAGASVYVESLRGTPFYVQMWIVYNVSIFTWPHFDGVYVLAGYLALTLNTIAYQAELFRAGFQSVGQGQIDAALSLGMRPLQVFRNITLPQGLRLVTLPVVNEWISLFKASSILNAIAVQEIMFQANDLGSNLGHPLEAFLLVALVYLAITIPLSRVTAWVERRRRIPGLGVQAVR